MSRKSQLQPFKIVDAGSMEAGIVSSVTDIQYLDNIAIQINTTGTDTGTVEIQGSVDYALDRVSNKSTAAGTWVTIALDTIAVGNTANPTLINMAQLAFPFIRLKYSTTTTGDSTAKLTALISGKVI